MWEFFETLPPWPTSYLHHISSCLKLCRIKKSQNVDILSKFSLSSPNCVSIPVCLMLLGGRHKCSMFPITYSEGLTGQISCIPAQNIIELFVLCFHELPHVFCPCKYLGAVHNWDLSLQVEPLVILHWTMENGRGFALAYATATEAKFVSMFYIMLSS